ncbi:hypothetical protein PHYBOEH_005466 [Phytophthora boehmeriae]|uniref:Uncharacterized protein n=1 Tax=Phytophthora boehmeriae TaxID=109152 RepID=A0A8T1WLZ4_9STRA|nr:hypothetical protein PHYBOEH_005466 [Phytophthora boehmeriae]
MVKRGSKSKPRRASPVDQLQAALTRQLKESVAETVVSVCEQFEEAVNEVATSGGGAESSSGGYDQYYADCRRLVDYIEQNMETSSGFTEQMDRIILACHSGATERVLSSVVTKQLWFHRRGDMPSFPAKEEEEKVSTRSGGKSSSSSSSTRSATKKKPKALPEPRMATRALAESPAMHTRSNSSTGKRMATRGSPHNAQPTKRPRRAARKIVHDTSDEEEKEEMQEEDEEPVKSTKSRKGKKPQLDVEEDDDDLLPFKDAIGELCYPERRTTGATRFFKDRLRKSIQFVDALLCKPPPGKVCARGCKKIRAQMCSSSTPCKNKMCRIWHDVEAHTDRCQNPQCEFKNRILLRETMHKVDIKNLQLTDMKAELQNKKDKLKAVADREDAKHQEEKTLLENDIAQLEHDVEEGNEELGVLEATKKTFWGILNDIGIELRDDAVDEFPDFSTHYEEKKARKARASPKFTTAASEQSSSAAGRNTRATRRTGSGPHGNDDDADADDADVESVGDNIPRRTVRRSTSGGPHDSPPPSSSRNDEETKDEDEHERNHIQEQEPEHSNNENYSREDEPPMPPVGPPPFRQNPELDRSYALASGYSIQPPADDLEAPAFGMDHDSAAHVDIPGVSVPTTAMDHDSTGHGYIPGVSVSATAMNHDSTTQVNVPDQNVTLELQLDMLRGKLSRRNQVLEVIRRAYYRDVIIIKEELRLHGGKLGHTGSTTPSSKELKAARQEMVRATKGEQQMRNVVHRMRSEAKQMEEVNEALQQRVRALMKENAYTLEQLQAARKIERDQKVIIAGLRSKLQLSQATQDEIDRLTNENKDLKQQLIRSNHDRDIFSASNNQLKEELAEVTKALHVVKVAKAQIEADFGTNYYRLQEETKKSKQLTADLAARDEQLKDKVALCNEQQQSLTSLKEELVSTLQRFEQTKRHLEDQLIEEERTREEMQEQNLEFRRLNKKLVRDLEHAQNQAIDGGIPPMFDDLDGADKPGISSKKDRSQRHQVAAQSAGMRNNVRKKLEDLQCQLEWALMRESDLAGMLGRYAGLSKAPMKRTLSRMPSKIVITRTATESDGANPAQANVEAAAVQETAQKTNERDVGHQSKRTSNSPHGEAEQSNSSSRIDEDFEDALEVADKNFEAYHKEIARMLGEIKEGKDKITKQQKVIADLERKNNTFSDRLEESKLSVEALTGSVNALKIRLNQDSAGAAEMVEAMLRQVDEAKRDQQYEIEKNVILMGFLRQVSESAHDINENKALLMELELDVVPPDEPIISEENIQMMELQRKKREVRRKVLMEKAMKKFSIICHNRAELIGVEMQKVRTNFERMREDLDQAENKIDSDQLHTQTLEAEISKLRLTVEVGKTNVGKIEKTLKQTAEDLNEYTINYKLQSEELAKLKSEHDKVQEDQKRLTLQLFEKTKEWQKEVSNNDMNNQKIARLEETINDISSQRQTLQKRLDEIEELAALRRSRYCDVGVSAIPETTELEIQTDRWKPQGLILRQRNGPDRMPQKYLGKASVMIHCPELNRLPSPGTDAAPVPENQEHGLDTLPGFTRRVTSAMADTDEHMRSMLELKVYPSPKAGGRQIKTSYASSRPKALSRLYLSSDGISQKYIASPSHQGDAEQLQRVSFDGRPATTL